MPPELLEILHRQGIGVITFTEALTAICLYLAKNSEDAEAVLAHLRSGDEDQVSLGESVRRFLDQHRKTSGSA